MAPSAQQIKHCFGTRQFIAILFSSITQETARRGSSAWHKQWVPDARESLHLLLSAWRALVKSGCVFLGRGCVSGWVVGRRPPRAALVPGQWITWGQCSACPADVGALCLPILCTSHSYFCSCIPFLCKDKKSGRLRIFPILIGDNWYLSSAVHVMGV